ncbi:mitogen-activated protein kinase kinase 10 [Magnolia sinica]|uniref:mitogen-activated protein kinase kinase 10 n=1 Tax=Magnolia sinica TaxID=86752 RepID=UPI00265B4D71|nr:mitogen-activated protein kinase kinase 10 [Magnolia sinica]
MAFRREKRNHQPLKLPLPTQTLALEIHHKFLLPSPDSHPLPPSLDSPPGIQALSDLKKLEVIGHGNGGTVYKVQHRWTSEVFALKVLRLGPDAAAGSQQANREADILKQVDSPFVVRCHGVFNGDDGDICFLMELMDRGSLHDVLRARQRLPEKLISYVAWRVLEGLRYLHGLLVVHRDIKPSNLLINDRWEVKIADFGSSRVVERNAHCSSYVGTFAYMSPERFDPDRCEGSYNGFAGDVWALGVVLLECHVGHFPLISVGQRPDWATLMCAICFGDPPEVPDTASPEFGNFVRRCLEKDWTRRATVQDLLNHPFVERSEGWTNDFDE